MQKQVVARPRSGPSSTCTSWPGSGDVARWAALAPGATVAPRRAPRRGRPRLAWEQVGAPAPRPAGRAPTCGTARTTRCRCGSTSRPSSPCTTLTFLEHPEWHERSKVVFFRRMIAAAVRAGRGDRRRQRGRRPRRLHAAAPPRGAGRRRAARRRPRRGSDPTADARRRRATSPLLAPLGVAPALRRVHRHARAPQGRPHARRRVRPRRRRPARPAARPRGPRRLGHRGGARRPSRRVGRRRPASCASATSPTTPSPAAVPPRRGRRVPQPRGGLRHARPGSAGLRRAARHDGRARPWPSSPATRRCSSPPATTGALARPLARRRSTTRPRRPACARPGPSPRPPSTWARSADRHVDAYRIAAGDALRWTRRAWSRALVTGGDRASSASTSSPTCEPRATTCRAASTGVDVTDGAGDRAPRSPRPRPRSCTTSPRRPAWASRGPIPPTSFHVNADGTLHVLEACRGRGRRPGARS